jgi:hypothetical protein
MRKTAPPLLAAGLLVILVGCQSTTRTIPDERASVQAEAATADDYIAAIRAAPTAPAEADAIRRLRQWEVRNGLTYQIQTVRIEDNAVVHDASVLNTPVRAVVTIYRGREVVSTFRFTPRDNRNLVLFGE